MTRMLASRSVTYRSIVFAMSALLLGCSKREAGRSADSSDMANMPGMKPSSSPSDSDTSKGGREVSLTAEQVRHGGVRWAPASAGPRGEMPATALALTIVPGQLAPNEDRTARLGAPGEGRVLVVRVSPGDRVRQGQVLVTLQSPAASMAQSDLTKATAAVASARAQAAYASSARHRAERLLTLKAIPRQEYERAIAEDDLTRAGVSQAEAELQRAQSTAAAVGATGAANGEVALRASLSGVVLERTTTPGIVVAAGTPLVVVTDPTHLWLTMSAPEMVIGLLQVGAALRFTVPAYPADTFSARLTVIGAGLDPETRTLPLRAAVSNSAGRLKPAMLATVLIPAPIRDGKRTAAQTGLVGIPVLLPADAVQLVGGRPTVFVAMPDDRGGAHFMGRPVQVGARSSEQVTITNGIAPGEVVVVQGAFAVKAAIEKRAMPKMEM